jgi:hypothetical protein
MVTGGGSSRYSLIVVMNKHRPQTHTHHIHTNIAIVASCSATSLCKAGTHKHTNTHIISGTDARTNAHYKYSPILCRFHTDVIDVSNEPPPLNLHPQILMQCILKSRLNSHLGDAPNSKTYEKRTTSNRCITSCPKTYLKRGLRGSIQNHNPQVPAASPTHLAQWNELCTSEFATEALHSPRIRRRKGPRPQKTMLRQKFSCGDAPLQLNMNTSPNNAGT